MYVASALYTRPCFGFRRKEDGELEIREEEAEIVTGTKRA